MAQPPSTQFAAIDVAGQALLRAAVDSMRDGVLVVDTEGRMLLLNERFRQLWGFPPELVAAGDDGAALEAAQARVADPEGFIARVRELYANRDLETLEDVELVDGTILERHGGPVRDGNGSYLGHLWSFRDVTAQRRQEQQRLRQARMRLDLLDRLDRAVRALEVAVTPSQVLLAILREGVSVLGASLGYVAVTADHGQALEVRRIDGETGHVEYLGEVPLDAKLPVAEAARTGAALFIGDNEHLQCNHPHLARLDPADHACATLPLHTQGDLQAVLNIAYDGPRTFDERDRELFLLLADRAAIALDRAMLFRTLEHQANAASALSYVDDAVFMVDERGVVRSWNPASERLLGVPVDAALHRPVEEVVPGWAQLREQLTLTEPGRTRSRQARVSVTVGGRAVTFTASGVRGPSGTVYAFRDVTEEQRLDRAKSDFVATVSHELRTPITSIMGSALTLQRPDIELDDDTRATLLNAIVTESQRLADIAGQVLLAGQIEAGGAQAELGRHDATTVVREAAAALDARAPESELTLELPDGPVPFVGDAGRLRQVLDNLLDNAVKYSPEAARITMRIERADDQVRIDVRDEGIGISGSDTERVFEKFYRVDPSMSRGVGGAGLGLYIARQLMRGMDGELEVSSPPEPGGRGSLFCATVPAAT